MPSRNAAAHNAGSLAGPGDARPTALQIVKDEELEGELGDNVVLITGCSSGIGIETARAFAATGAVLYLTVRNPSKGKDALSSILSPGRVELLEMDNQSLASVRSAAKTFLSKSKTLNILINNAGIMALPEATKTADGFEAQFATNHLAHFLLFPLLKPTIQASATQEFPSRVVCVSSSGHRAGGPNFGDYNFDKGGYSPWVAYGQSKTASIYMANEIERRYSSRNLHALSLHPGGISTGLQKHVSEDMSAQWSTIPNLENYTKSPEQGAATTMYAALSGDWKGKGGRFLEDCDEAPPLKENASPIDIGYAPHAYDEKGEKQLWADSLKMVGEEDDD